MNIKLHKNGVMPKRAHFDDAGMDCYARADCVIEPGETAIVPLGFGVELPAGIEMQIRGRSSMAAKGIWCHLGTVDCGYRGEVSAILHNLTHVRFFISAGERVAQAVLASFRSLPLHEVEKLGESKRGTGGFGSTGV
jgi:dUTP pyrophosphatase